MKKTILILSLASMGLASAAFAQEASTTTTKSKTTVTQGDRTTYKAAKKQADATYKAAKKQCDALSGRAKADCVGIARAEQRLAKANAETQYKPTEKNQMNARMAAAEVDYAKAKAKCDSAPAAERQTGTAVDVCMSQAAEARNQAIANAKAGKEAAEEGRAKTPGKSMDTRGDIGKK